MARQRRRRLAPDFERSGGYVSLGAMACLAFVYAGSAPLFDWPALVVLAVVWVGLTVTVIRWFSPYPVRTLWFPLTGLVVWLAAVLLEAASR